MIFLTNKIAILRTENKRLLLTYCYCYHPLDENVFKLCLSKEAWYNKKNYQIQISISKKSRTI